MLRFFHRHSVGFTMLAVAVLAVVPSLLEIPAKYKAFPDLLEKPAHTLLVAVWPKAAMAPPQPTVAVLPDDPDTALVLPELDLSSGGKGRVSRGLSYEDDREGQKWEAVIKKVGAEHVDIEDPCVQRGPNNTCLRTALDPFFRALRSAREPRARAPVRIVTLGTSLIASDHITDVARRRLQSRHGSGGLGYMYVDRPTRGAGRDVRCGKATDGWNIDKLTDEKWAQDIGLAGVSFSATANSPQTVSYSAVGQRLAEVFLATQPNGGELEISIDGQLAAELSTEGDAVRPATSIIELPEGSKRIELKTRNGPVRVDGVSLETAQPGVIFDALGLPGGTAAVFLRANEEVFGAQLLERRPALVVLLMGGNEAFDLSLNRYTMAEAKKNFEVLIDRVRRHAPQAACLLMSPPDAGVWRMDKTITPRKETAAVAAFMHEVAYKKGCAIWDMQAAMGGEGAIERWWNAHLMNEDLVHPIGVGGDVFGYLMDMAIERARQRHEANLMAARTHNRRAPPVERPLALHPRPSGVGGRFESLEAISAVIAATGGADGGAVAREPRTRADGGVGGATREPKPKADGGSGASTHEPKPRADGGFGAVTREPNPKADGGAGAMTREPRPNPNADAGGANAHEPRPKPDAGATDAGPFGGIL